MSLLFLALFPAIALLIYIYKKDKKEKEPMGLLIKLLIFGAISGIPAALIETIDDGILGIFSTEGSLFYALIDGFLVAGLTEEALKYFFLKKITWKNRNFNCMFDGIVYSVFVSIGFAGLENIGYVFDGGVSVAISRMFTAIPGHMVYAVYMGYYYSQAKLAEVKGDHALKKKMLKRALFIPVLLHGFYDSLIMVEDGVVNDFIIVLFMLIWFAYVIILFIKTFGFVKRASKSDEYIVLVSEDGEKLAPRIVNNDVWQCKACKALAYGNFCTNCGAPRP